MRREPITSDARYWNNKAIILDVLFILSPHTPNTLAQVQLLSVYELNYY